MPSDLNSKLNPAQPQPSHHPKAVTPRKPGAFDWLILVSGIAAIALIITGEPFRFGWGRSPYDPSWDYTPAPLVMQGGDPYIRALMRTISASEANSPKPYSLLYGGEHFQDLGQHPDRCIPIMAGPNVGDCTTAAGRYQFITTTWLEKAKLYHPYPQDFLFWQSYSFEPEFQDKVVYAWLSDPDAWGVDLAELLRAGELAEVLYILSPTWTSLGYGIEPNVMTEALPAIYESMLQEELASVAQ
ncbi:glycoside hydrolase family protein [Oscillatoria sp. FACHB-1407]|uniref:glycoside hydrolase family 24 protein n=1 Tax=Oscillatoria sp. FACHB-1407 TaxID=2692847 RepID=UPI001689A311|nr:glycoside hydrolase family protein [Oscillatoria sp. FACHB-1407]MBD2460770.1 glycoside hydrolase family protein [Oscillatoria sp. FACHB-1407]